MTSGPVAEILRDLPDMPEEVAAHWLAPHAARPGFGWPPPENGRTAPWDLILAGRPLDWWQDRIWCREHLPMVLEYMSNATRFQVTRLQQAAETGNDRLPDSCKRIAAVRAHIAETGTWPHPPVAFPDADGLALADGHHRLAALAIERARGRIALQDRHHIWIALPGVGGAGQTTRT